MLIVRGTKKLRDRWKQATPAAESDTSTTVLGDWFATVLFWRPHVVLLVDARTYLPVLVPYAPSGTLADRIPIEIGRVLARNGAPAEFVEREVAEMAEVRIAPTNDRRVLGVMNEFVFLANASRDDGTDDIDVLTGRLAGVPLGPLFKSTISADRELAAVLADHAAGPAAPAGHLAEVLPLRPRPTSTATAPDSRPEPESSRSVAPVYRCKVTLRDVKPPVWRRILVDGSQTLDHLHEVIQAAFGWWNTHLHEFEIDDVHYGVPDPDDDIFGPPLIDESTVRLDSVAGVGTRIDYLYDFGDGWEHRVVIEAVEEPDPERSVPACIGGRRACPPEDCGGPWGYERLLAVLADPAHREHREMREWLGRPFDPEAFDPDDFAHNLALQEATNFDP